jgi:D-alanine-D-alanine ligase
MRVAFLYNEAIEDPFGQCEDDEPSLSPVVAALHRLGHEVEPIACTLDLAALRSDLERARPDVALNRVESLGGSDAMMAAVTLLLDMLHIPYTGCSTAALVATASKLIVKQRLHGAGLPTPPWITSDGKQHGATNCTASQNPQSAVSNPKFILKSVLEHASFHMNDDAIVGPLTTKQIAAALRRREKEFERPFFAEQFIEGREFNLSVIGGKTQVLPPAEIDFSSFPPEKPRIVSQRAKTIEHSFEWENTDRTFEFSAADRPLIKRLTELAAECWRVLDLSGYVRVDFRVDFDNEPWILEVNSNPCLMPNSGFAGALNHAGISYDAGIQLLMDNAIATTSNQLRREKPRVFRIVPLPSAGRG